MVAKEHDAEEKASSQIVDMERPKRRRLSDDGALVEVEAYSQSVQGDDGALVEVEAYSQSVQEDVKARAQAAGITFGSRVKARRAFKIEAHRQINAGEEGVVRGFSKSGVVVLWDADSLATYVDIIRCHGGCALTELLLCPETCGGFEVIAGRDFFHKDDIIRHVRAVQQRIGDDELLNTADALFIFHLCSFYSDSDSYAWPVVGLKYSHGKGFRLVYEDGRQASINVDRCIDECVARW